MLDVSTITCLCQVRTVSRDSTESKRDVSGLQKQSTWSTEHVHACQGLKPCCFLCVLTYHGSSYTAAFAASVAKCRSPSWGRSCVAEAAASAVACLCLKDFTAAAVRAIWIPRTRATTLGIASATCSINTTMYEPLGDSEMYFESQLHRSCKSCCNQLLLSNLTCSFVIVGRCSLSKTRMVAIGAVHFVRLSEPAAHSLSICGLVS